MLTRLPLDKPGFVSPAAPDRWAGADRRPAVVRWQALADAGLIGSTPPMSAAVLASIHAAEAVLCSRRGGGR